MSKFSKQSTHLTDDQCRVDQFRHGDNEHHTPQRTGHFLLIGPTNAGKSTLINALVSYKVSGISHKINMTQRVVRGIMTDSSRQLIILDTPGLITTIHGLAYAKQEHNLALKHSEQVDVVGVIVDAQRSAECLNASFLKRLEQRGAKNLILILNKVDCVKKDRLLSLTQAYANLAHWDSVFMISALKRDGLDALKRYLLDVIPIGNWLYPPQQKTEQSLEELCEEITREQLFARLHEELPYALRVSTTSLVEVASQALRVEQTIFVQKRSQVAIVCGQNGQTIKTIGTGARYELKKILKREVHLFLHVKVSKTL